MKFGRIITVTKKRGFSIDPSLLRSVGIYNQSKCWGVVIDGGDNKNSGIDKSTKDFIFCPYPYRSWPCIVRLQIRVCKTSHRNVYQEMIQCFQDHHLNVLSMQLVHGGYNHNVIDAIVELYKFREKANEIRLKADNVDNFNEPWSLGFQSKIAEFALNLYAHMYDLEDKITKKFGKYLYTSIQSGYDTDKEEISHSALYCKKIFQEALDRAKDIDDNIKDKLKQIDDLSVIRAIEWKWVRALAFHSFIFSKSYLRFEYNMSKKLLSLDESYPFNKDNFYDSLFPKPQTSDVDRPFQAFAEFDPDTMHVRVRPIILADREASLYELKAFYKCTYEPDFSSVNGGNKKDNDIQDIAYYGSKGIISDILLKLYERDSAFKPIGISLEGLSRKSRREERGSVFILGTSTNKYFTEYYDRCLEAEIKKANDDKISETDNIKGKRDFSVTVKSKVIRPYRVFVSVRECFKTLDNREKIITDILHDYGFEPVLSKTATNSVTSSVIRDIESCDACIQIYSLSESERLEILKTGNGTRSEFIPNCSWLLFELGVASKHGMAIGKMIDTTYFSKENWQIFLRTDTDKLLTDFRTDVQFFDSFSNKLKALACELFFEIEQRG